MIRPIQNSAKSSFRKKVVNIRSVTLPRATPYFGQWPSTETFGAMWMHFCEEKLALRQICDYPKDGWEEL